MTELAITTVNSGHLMVTNACNVFTYRDKADSPCLLSTAAVAGMIAYFMGEGNSGAASRQNIVEIGVVRRTNGPLTLWNNVDGNVE